MRSGSAWRIQVAVAAAALSLLPAAPTHAATIEVDWAGSGDYERIQDGIDAASPGDTVLVHPGTYAHEGNRNLDFGGKDIVLRSLAGWESTTIDAHGAAGGHHRGFYLHSGETSAAVIEEFTIADASGWGFGGGIRCDNASVTIRNCRFLRCYAYGYTHMDGWCGAGLFHNSSSTIENCIVEQCGAHAHCTGFGFLGASDVTVRDCVFVDNYSGDLSTIGAVWLDGDATVSVDRCTFIGNAAWGAGVVVSGRGRLWLTGSTFALNNAYRGALVDCRGTVPAEIVDCIFAFNLGLHLIDCEDADPTIAFCCIYENDVQYLLCGNYDDDELLREDPLFCDIASGEPWLCADSPCLPQNNDWGRHIGSGLIGCGNCDTAVDPTSWGRIKAMYR